MAMICLYTLCARCRKYAGDEDDFTQRAGGGTVWQRMQCRSKGSFGWCGVMLRKVGIGIGWSWVLGLWINSPPPNYILRFQRVNLAKGMVW